MKKSWNGTGQECSMGFTACRRSPNEMKRRYSITDPTPAETHYTMFAGRIDGAAAAKEWPRARALALEWAHGLGHDLKLRRFTVWKEFKRALAARWFGAPEHRVFVPQWSPEAVLTYLAQFKDRHVRVSVFSAGIACHAPSQRLPAQRDLWPGTMAQLDRDTLIEAFPESSSAQSLCFRRYCTAFGEEVVYEAGRGQAMPVFESEQGRHSTAFARRLGTTDFTTGATVVPDYAVSAALLGQELAQLITQHDATLQLKCGAICRRTGIEWTSLEGYYDPLSNARVTIVDMDLPFDYVFMAE